MAISDEAYVDYSVDGEESDPLTARVKGMVEILTERKQREFCRHVSVGDLLTERSQNAAACGFGEGTTMYDNVLVLGDVRVGKYTWIGPNVILDGCGSPLVVGDWVSISAGVQIYTHHTVNRSVSMGALPIDYAPTVIGSGVYIGPNSVVQMGVKIGDRAVIGAMSFVNRDIPADATAFGQPARVRPSTPQTSAYPRRH